MILVEVKEYCQTCDNFDPDVKHPTKFFANDVIVDTVGDTIIRCKNRILCENIRCQIKREMERGSKL